MVSNAAGKYAPDCGLHCPSASGLLGCPSRMAEGRKQAELHKKPVSEREQDETEN